MSADPTFPERRAIAENLGRIALVWNHVESTSHIILWGVIDPNRGSDDCRPLTLGQSVQWVWDTTLALLSNRPGSTELVEWFKAWRIRAGEGLRKRNEAIHAWWLPTGEVGDPYKVLDMTGSKSRKGYRENVIEGGSATLLEWIDEISAISEDQIDWLKGPLLAFLSAPAADPLADPPPPDPPQGTGGRTDRG